MKIFYNDSQYLHHPNAELHRGALIAPHECPARMDYILKGMAQAGFSELLEPEPCDLAAILAVHSEAYIDFLQTAWQRWHEAGYSGDVLPMSYPRGKRRRDPPASIDGAAGYYSMSSDTVITATSWQASMGGADCAASAVTAITDGAKSAFALTRPPGHHAGTDYMGGYCLVNNSAVAAQLLRDSGAKAVAVLDVDFHHGNGTQDIFYARDDVFFASIHGEPDQHYPYFWGYRDETGIAQGIGSTANYPLPAGSTYAQWSEALNDALARTQGSGAEALVVSLGVDTFAHDPISSFQLISDDFARYGAMIGELKLPTVFVMEGGYGVPEIGLNVARVLSGFLNGS